MRDDNASAMNTPMGRHAPRRSIAALGLVIGVAIVWTAVALSVLSVEGQRNDNAAMEAIYAHSSVENELLSYLGYVSIGTAFVVLIVLVGLSFIAGNRHVAIGITVFVAGANLTTQLLKVVIDRPHHFDALENSLPSGHTTLVASFAFAALVVTPKALRYPAVFGAAFLTVATGASTVAAGWHRPSDVFAALAVCLIWAGLVTLLIGWSRDYGPLSAALWSLGGAVGAGVLLVAVGVRPSGGWSGFTEAAVVLSAMGAATALTVTFFTRMVTPAKPVVPSQWDRVPHHP